MSTTAKYVKITVGTSLMTVAVGSVFDVMGIVFGGVTGIGIIIKNIIPVPIWVTNFVLNIPLFLFGFKLFGKKTMIRTLIATLMFTILLAVMPVFDILVDEKIINVIFGSVLLGTGLGLIFSTFTSGGGTDLVAMILNRRIRYLSIPKIMALIDGIVVIFGMIVFGFESGLYSLVAIYLIAKISDKIIEGFDTAKLIYVISDHYEEVSNYILGTMQRGVTSVQVQGMYTQNVTKMLLCVVYSKEMVRIKEKIYKIDKNAICFVGDIREAFGEGFTKYH